MKTDIEIAQESELYPITDVLKTIGIEEDEIEHYGKYKAKITEEAILKREGNKDGKLILTTAINPTPAGEGKTTVSIGLADALYLEGKKTCLALREPSLGPVFGLKGGAALNTYKCNRFLLPGCGNPKFSVFIAGRLAFPRNEVMKWLKISDADYIEYSKEGKLGFSWRKKLFTMKLSSVCG